MKYNHFKVKAGKLLFLLSILSGILFTLAWNSYFPALSLFFGFVPLIFLLENKNLHCIEIFKLSLLTFLIYHLGTVWWLYKSSFFGFIIIITLNSIYLAVAMTLIYRVRQLFGLMGALFAFIFIWLTFEYIHYSWELSWPFMNLGNWLGQVYPYIQWYEYTGVLGGTLWILIINIVIYLIIKSILLKKMIKSSVYFIILLIIIILPIRISLKLYADFTESNEKLTFKIIQPNIDPYSEKYHAELYEKQTSEQLAIAKEPANNGIDCYLFPESTFPAYIDEDSCSKNQLMKRITDELLKNDRIMVIGGMYSYRVAGNDSLFYNTAFYRDQQKIETRHKSKLVTGVEKMPFQQYFTFLKKWNINLGGYTNSLTADNEPIVFNSFKGNISTAPIICYESVYGQYVTEFVKKGATVIAVITNDGWWGNTPGYRQHLMHSQLRAIETRRNVVRAANTGTSCFINSRGDIVSKLKPFTRNSLTGSAFQNHQLTFYTKYGDFIGKYAAIASLMTLIIALYPIILRQRTVINQ